jgi:hypothetical protein
MPFGKAGLLAHYSLGRLAAQSRSTRFRKALERSRRNP